MKKEMKVKNIRFTRRIYVRYSTKRFCSDCKSGDLEKLLEIKGVTLVEPDAEVHAFEDPVSSENK